MLSTPAQCEHFAVPSNATTVVLDRPQFLHFQFRKACSINVPAFFADTGDGHALGGIGPSEGARTPSLSRAPELVSGAKSMERY